MYLFLLLELASIWTEKLIHNKKYSVKIITSPMSFWTFLEAPHRITFISVISFSLGYFSHLTLFDRQKEPLEQIFLHILASYVPNLHWNRFKTFQVHLQLAEDMKFWCPSATWVPAKRLGRFSFCRRTEMWLRQQYVVVILVILFFSKRCMMHDFVVYFLQRLLYGFV